MISSEQNNGVKRVVALQKKQKQRMKESCFVVEGIKMVSETPKDLMEQVYMSQEVYGEHASLVKDLPYEIVSSNVFKKMSDTMTPQGILAVVRMPQYDIEKTLSKGSGTVLLLESLQDPGNMGTIIRTAEAIGVQGILTTKGTVDIYHPKVLRATMGAIYHLPIFTQYDGLEASSLLKDHGYTLLAAHLSDSHFHYETDLRGKTCFMIGNEGNGLTDTLTQEADQLIKLPMLGQSESLNAAVAASILMYEAHRQRQ